MTEDERDKLKAEYWCPRVDRKKETCTMFDYKKPAKTRSGLPAILVDDLGSSTFPLRFRIDERHINCYTINGKPEIYDYRDELINVPTETVSGVFVVQLPNINKRDNVVRRMISAWHYSYTTEMSAMHAAAHALADHFAERGWSGIACMIREEINQV